MSTLEYLTVEEVAAVAKVNEQTVRRWLRAGLLRGARLSGHGWRVRVDELARFMESGEAAGHAHTGPKSATGGLS